eukprot:870495-Pyramimonas_sp.AAC.1
MSDDLCLLLAARGADAALRVLPLRDLALPSPLVPTQPSMSSARQLADLAALLASFAKSGISDGSTPSFCA